MSQSSHSPHPLSYDGTYQCPVCRHGEISTLPLMEAFACNFCRHIFTANLAQQVVKIEDSRLPLAWRWAGRNWKGTQAGGTELSWAVSIAGLLFVALPTAIVGFGAYWFPPLPDSHLSWFPIFWTVLTFLSHSLGLAWLVVEYYQFPLGLYVRAWVQGLRSGV